MSVAEFTASVRRAFELSNRSRATVGLPLNKKPPRHYCVTMWFSPELYVILVNAAKAAKKSLAKYMREELELQSSKRVAWPPKRRSNVRLAA